MFFHPRRSRVLKKLLALYALITTPFLFQGFVRAFEAVAPPVEATLVVVSEVPLREVRVTYGGRTHVPKPDVGGMGAIVVVVPGLRPGPGDSDLTITWTHSNRVETVRERFDPQDSDPPLCTLLLRVDAAGRVMSPLRSAFMDGSVLDVSCGFR